MKAHFTKFLLLAPALIAIVFCLRMIHEPDLWWQLRTGEYILENGEVPKEDVFSFTYAGVAWLNVKWGFEVIQAATVNIFGASALPLPQIFSNLLLLIILFLASQVITKNKLSISSISIALLLLLIGMSYRMNGRPELVTYTLTAFYLLVFVRVDNGEKGWLYALIPAQLIWANLHEAYGVGIVMMLTFLGAEWFGFISSKIKTSAQRKFVIKHTIIVFIAWIAVAVHPSGLQMLWHPYEIFTQLSQNQFTQEIFSAAKKDYWHMPAFVGLAMALIAAYQLYSLGKLNGKFSLKTLFKVVPLFYTLLYVAFFYLSLKSYRNLPFILIVSTPLVAVWLNYRLKHIKPLYQQIGVIAFSLLLYLSIVTNGFYRAFLPAEQYGWGINTAKNPVGAAEFISNNKLKGPAFTDYLSSSYLLWKLQPEFKTFVDLRDLDVFEAEDMEIAITCCTHPERRTGSGSPIWDVVDAKYHFNYVAVLNNLNFIPLHRYLLASGKFKLVYADALCAVFVRNTPANANLLAQYEQFNFQPLKPVKAQILPQLFWPFYAPHSQSAENYERAKSTYAKAVGLTL